MADLTKQQRERRLEYAKSAHRVKPNVPLSWFWLLEWASGLVIAFPQRTQENKPLRYRVTLATVALCVTPDKHTQEL